MHNGDELLVFVKEALARGLPRPRIEEALLQAGWKPEQVKNALAAFAEIDFPVPVPKPMSHLPAREAFLYLVLFTTLYISAYSFGSLLFQFIDRAFPDVATPGDPVEGFRQAVRWSVSSLIVALPVFLYVSRVTGKMVAGGLSERGSNARRGLTYATLFVTAAIIIADFIALIYNFLGGELTIRFVLKALTIGLIGAGIFFHYLRGLRVEDRGSRG